MKIFLVPLADLADTGEIGEERVLVRGNETVRETLGFLEVIDGYREAALVGGLRYHHLEHCLGETQPDQSLESYQRDRPIRGEDSKDKEHHRGMSADNQTGQSNPASRKHWRPWVEVTQPIPDWTPRSSTWLA